MRNIEDQSNRYQIIWDLGRRCSYACSYCPPHRNNKWSSFIDYKTLCTTVDKVAEYALMYDQFRRKPAKKKLSFTGGEPTVHPDFFRFLKYVKQEYPFFSRGLTTNGWFGNSIGPYQHYAHSRFRSIEQGKTLIRSANNGISAIINPSGKIKSLIDLEETGSIYTNEIKHKVTLFSKYGNKMYFVLIFIYIFLILSIRRLDHE